MAVVRKCLVRSDVLMSSDRSDPVQIRPVTDSVRRFGIADACFCDFADSCPQNEALIVKCNGSVPKGDLF